MSANLALARMHNYPRGTKIQRTNRYVFIKQQTGQWKAEHRWVMEQKVLGRDLEEGERVFHRNGIKDENDPGNLVVVKFSTTKFVPLKKSVVLFIPKKQSQMPSRANLKLVEKERAVA